MKKEVRKSKIGGQALIEGVMMRGIDKISMAVRVPSGEIDVEHWAADDLANPKWYRKIPVLRGVVGFVDSLVLGYKCLMKSAEKAGLDDEDENEEPSWLEKKLGDHIFKIAGVIGGVLGVVLAVGLFMYLPSLATKGVASLFSAMPNWAFSLVEGLLKILIFVGYLALISRMKDIRRTFEYHGAEHKTIACYEADVELTPENVKKFTRFHPRCGTSFLLIALVMSILVFSLVTWDNLAIRMVLKIVFLPVVVGLSYELIRIAGKYDNLFTKIVSAPGLCLQRLTTREPDEEEIEVAIAAMEVVIPQNKEVDNW